MNVEKYFNENGQVGVLVSSGFGAGWSTWNDAKEFFIFDKTLIEMKLDNIGEDKVQEYIEGKLNNVCAYMGGWKNCHVLFMSQDEEFIIEEYDGSETLSFKDDYVWIKA